MRIFVTGIGGFLGSALARFLVGRGHDLRGSRRTVPDRLPSWATGIVPMTLGQPFDRAVFAGAEVVVHCAHDFAPGHARQNVSGTAAVYQAALENGVRRQVFLSSYSARPDSAAAYGRVKHEIESFFLERGELVIRPGLVVGYGGLFGRNMLYMLRWPLLPLLDGGNARLPVVSLRDFLEGTEALIAGGRSGAYNLFSSQLVAMRTLCGTLNRQARHRSLIVPIPSVVAIAALEAARALGVRLPVDADNVRAVRLNQAAIHDSHLLELLGREDSLEEMIAATLTQMRVVSDDEGQGGGPAASDDREPIRSDRRAS